MSASFSLDYSIPDVEVRQDLQDAHRAVLEHLRRPGPSFRGAQRLAIAAESRAAEHCGLCRERKASLSPEQPAGEHTSVSELPAPLVEIAHRLRVDSGRLSRAWFDRQLAAGVRDTEYVEAVGCIALLAGLDAFCTAAGIPRFALPEPVAGEPSGARPENLTDGIAWVPILAPEDATGPEADLYPKGGFVPNIVRALSLVPDHVRMLQIESNSHYIPIGEMMDPKRGRDLDRLQIELVAARVSALNECFY